MKSRPAFVQLLWLAGLIIAFPCNESAASGAFPVATNPGVEMSVNMAFDGANYLVGIQGDELAENNITAQLIGPTGALVGSRIMIGRTGGVPGVSFDGTNYLLVWEDDAITSNDDIYGQRVSPAGALVGGAFLINGAAGDQHLDSIFNRVAFGGGKHLVVYRDDRSGTKSVYGQLVSTTGALSGPEIIISADTLAAQEASVAFDGSNFLVVWQKRNGAPEEQYDTVGAFISPSGTVTAPFVISQSPSARFNPLTIVFNGSNHFVVWNRDGGNGYPDPSDFDVHGRFVSPTGLFPGDEIALVTGSGDQTMPGVAFDGANYLLSWTDGATGSSSSVKFQFRNPAAWALDEPFELFSAQGTNRPFVGAPVFDGTRFGVIATLADVDGSFNFQSGDVYGAFIPRSATPHGNLIGIDDFDDNQKDKDKWGVDFTEGNASLTASNGRLDFTSGAGSEVAAGRIWCLNYGSYTQDWEVQADVNIGSVDLTGAGQQVDVNLNVLNNDGWDRAGLEVNFKVNRDSLGAHRAFKSYVAADYTWLEPYEVSHPTLVQSAALRVTFDAASKTLTTWYSETSGAQAYDWHLLRQVDVDAAGSDWNMTAASTFSVAIGGFSDNFSVTPEHQVSIDNFRTGSAMNLSASESWRLQYFGNPANSGKGADAATPAHDGIPNLIKYGLAIAPGSSSVGFLPPAQTRSYAEGKRLALVFTRDPAHNDATQQVLAASAVDGPWSVIATSADGAAFAGAGFVSETDASGGLKTVEIRDTVNMSAAPRRFMRVSVSR